jgi:hypothetical protein
MTEKDKLSKLFSLVECLEVYKLSNADIQEVTDSFIDLYKCDIELGLLNKAKEMSNDCYPYW